MIYTHCKGLATKAEAATDVIPLSVASGKAVAQNEAAAQFNLGYCYANGQGVAKDEAEAVKWFRRWFRIAADQSPVIAASKEATSTGALLSPEQFQEGERRYREFSSRNNLSK